MRFFISFLLSALFILESLPAQSLIDSLQEVLPQSEGVEKARILSDLVWYMRGDSLERDLGYAKEELAHAQELDDSLLMGTAYNDLAIVYYMDGDLDASMTANQQALVLRERYGSMAEVASSLAKIADINVAQGNFEASIESYLLLVQVYDSLGMIAQKMAVRQNMSSLYKNLRSYDRGLALSKENILYFQEVDDPSGMGISYNNMANAYSGLGMPDSSIWAYRLGIEQLERIDDPLMLGQTQMNLGSELAMVNQLKEAIPLLHQAEKELESLGNLPGIVAVYSALGNTYRRLGDYDRALNYLNKALPIAKEQHFLPDLTVIYGAIGFTYENLRNDTEAHRYYLLSNYLMDSLNGEEVDNKILTLEAKFKAAEQQREIERLEQEQEISRLTIRQRNLQLVAVFGLLIAAAVLLVLWMQRSRLKQEQALNALKLTEQEKRLQVILSTQEEERSRIARDLHDGIGQSLAATRIQLSNLKAIKANQESSSILSMIDEVCDDVRELAHQMMPRSLTYIGLVKATEEMLQKTLESSEIRYDLEVFGPEKRLDSAIEIGLYRICQELISNVLKHAQATQVSVQFLYSAKQCVLQVEDNGVGISHSQSSKGLGMSNMQSRAEAVSGSFSIEKGPERGSVATVRIPLSEKV